MLGWGRHEGRLVSLTLLCIATYRKGDEFLRECRRQGCRVLLLTEEKLRDADWPREAIDEFYYVRRDMPLDDIRKGAAHLARAERLDRIVALDDFDVELAAMLREYLFVPGMGETTARRFRDKLAMRRRARSAGLACPLFVHTLNDDEIRAWIDSVPPPWVLKPRWQAAALGIRRLSSASDLWNALEIIGDTRADYLLEQFVPGDVFHVDSIVFDDQVRFACASRYETPPLVVAHDAGIFVTRTLPPGDRDADALEHLNARVLESFGLRRGVSHTEFIRARDGSLYFLETSARVGGAFIVDVVEAATGINLWREWARVEVAGENGRYEPPPRAHSHGGIVLSLARQESPDTSAYTDPEIVMRVRKSHHAGLIVASPDNDRVVQLLRGYTERFYADFHASAPPPERPTD
jgi:biotin carboxylase